MVGAGASRVGEGQEPARPLLAERRVATFWILLLASVVATLVSFPYVFDLMAQGNGALAGEFADPRMSARLMRGVLAGALLVQGVVFTSLGAGLGLLVAPETGLGAPFLQGWLAGRPLEAHRARSAFRTAALVGAGVGVVLTLIAALGEGLAPAGVSVTHPPPWSSALGSVGAAVNEEIWMRLGAMGVLVRLLMTVRRTVSPSASTVWAGNVAAALLFGALHLPQATALAPDGGVGLASLGLVLGMNGVAGVTFGWLYWRLGLLAAMVGHLAADLVLHVAGPMVLGG